MPSFSTKRRVPYSARQMYDLVADIERYPEFLPLCEELSLRSRDVKDDKTVLVATMVAGYKAIRESVTTRVALLPKDNQVLVEYLDGPFRYLQNRWVFRPLPNGGCEVDFFIEYELKSVMLSMLVGALFDKAFRRFAEAFEDRARKIYVGEQHVGQIA